MIELISKLAIICRFIYLFIYSFIFPKRIHITQKVHQKYRGHDFSCSFTFLPQ